MKSLLKFHLRLNRVVIFTLDTAQRRWKDAGGWGLESNPELAVRLNVSCGDLKKLRRDHTGRWNWTRADTQNTMYYSSSTLCRRVPPTASSIQTGTDHSVRPRASPVVWLWRRGGGAWSALTHRSPSTNAAADVAGDSDPFDFSDFHCAAIWYLGFFYN